MTVAVAIIAILCAAAATLLLTSARGRRATGRLSRETRRRDTGPSGAVPAAETPASGDDASARGRADETRAALEGVGAPAVSGGSRPEIDEEELGVTRRQFLNRGVIASMAFGIASFGAGALAFIWPVGGGGFGGKVKAGRVDDILAEIASKKAPFYVPEARSYVVAFPKDQVSAAEKSGYKPAVLSSMEEGVVALYQKCPHLGCRVPWCQSSQWFECPCHGSKYNAIGEKRDGPAPRGMSLWPATISAGALTIDTSGAAIDGMPIGVDTTGQKPEGPPCV